GHLGHELASVGLSKHFLRKRLSELSAGQLQRVLIAWSLIGHPDVLLFDEPTSGIDVGGEETIYSLLHRLQDERNISIIIVSHDLHVVYHYANDVLCLNKEMVCHGPPRDVLTQEQLKKLYGEVSFYHHLNHA
ncbi:ATP-binding cassette domain-containing protein, partial [Patescibacteria group bacterium]|nr:ATP-binding cassette domain-containing protein [Patescibacteria group bacterium]